MASPPRGEARWASARAGTPYRDGHYGIVLALSTRVAAGPGPPEEGPVTGPGVAVTNQQSLLEVPTARIVALVRSVLAAEGVDHAMSIALVDDAEITRLHGEFLGDPTPTDVIAFPLRDADDPPAPDGEDDPLGEVVASAETAIREAAERGLPAERELLLYLVHGTLHLLGYDDHDPDERAVMHARQEELLAAFVDGTDAEARTPARESPPSPRRAGPSSKRRRRR